MLDSANIDGLLRSLEQPLTVERRLDVLDQLVSYWHGPCRSEDGYSEEELLGSVLPDPLRWWYHRGGRRANVLSRQNRLLAPNDLTVECDGRIIFYVENQGVYIWATDPRGEDPAVWGKFDAEGEPWIMEEASLSGFLIQICLFEAIFGASYGASASWANQALLDRVTAPLRLVPLGSWRWPSYPGRFWASNGTFVFAGPNGPSDEVPAFSMWVGARSARPLGYLKSIVDDGWEYTAC